MDNNQKVAILLAEYNSLKAEALAARSYIAQGIAITAAVIMGIVALNFSTNSPSPLWSRGLILLIASSYLLITMRWNLLNIDGFRKRLRDLEKNINERAGEPLLVWETTLESITKSGTPDKQPKEITPGAPSALPESPQQ